MITIIDYGLGNLASVANMFRRVGVPTCITSNPLDIETSSKLVLAGVGAFDNGMENLSRAKIREALQYAVLVRRVPVLGICLGMQLMFESSEEGQLPGLSWLPGRVRRIQLPSRSKLKIPHMGWNTINVKKPSTLFAANESERRFYFVHSYHAECTEPENLLATVVHGGEITAAVERANIYGVQFHPEKSHTYGVALMTRFSKIAC